MTIELKPQTHNKVLWIAVFGFLIPIVVGVLYRSYLLFWGRVITGSELAFIFSHHSALVLLSSFLTADIPFIFTALIAERMLRVEPISTTSIRVASVAGMVIATTLPSTVFFFMVWSYSQFLNFFFRPRLILPYLLPWTFIGLGLGWLVGRLLPGIESTSLRHQPVS